jgi:hypothetical protein
MTSTVDSLFVFFPLHDYDYPPLMSVQGIGGVHMLNWRIEGGYGRVQGGGNRLPGQSWVSSKISSNAIGKRRGHVSMCKKQDGTLIRRANTTICP